MSDQMSPTPWLSRLLSPLLDDAGIGEGGLHGLVSTVLTLSCTLCHVSVYMEDLVEYLL